jgi:tRNA G37 N-methylase Trm5
MNELLRELKNQYEEEMEIYNKQWHYALDLPTIEEYQNHIAPFIQKIKDVECKIISNSLEPKFIERQCCGTCMSLDDFLKSVNSGFFNDYDGYGNLCIDNKPTELQIYPSLINNENLKIPEIYNSVMWFNK